MRLGWFLRNKKILGVFATAFAVFFLSRVFVQPLRKSFPSSSAVYDRNGRLLRLTLTNDQKYRQWVTLDGISPEIIKAFLDSEDRHFYTHLGLNPWSLGRAAWTTYLSHGRRTGGSTITMQLARRIYSIESRQLPGKLQQIWSAIELELFHSKKEILEAYLNLVPMGGNIEGVGAASLIFFQKKAAEIQWPQALALAVIPQNPSKRTLLHGYTSELHAARMRLFSQIKSLIGQQFHRAIPEGLAAFGPKDLPFVAPHFVQTVLDRSSSASDIPTTLDSRLQKVLELRLQQYLSSTKDRGIRNASVLLVNWQTLETLSWIGSANFFDSAIQGQVDGVTSIRSPGSALKPFIYGLALDQGQIHPGTILKDSPRSFGSYDPENFDGDFQGPISAENALNQSRNIPAVDLVSRLKSPDFYDFMVRAGSGIPRNRDYYGYSIALGGFEVSLLDLVNLYTILPRKGYRGSAAIVPSEKEKLAPLSQTSLLSSMSAFMVLDILSRNEIHSRRYRRIERSNAIPISWKTGTSSGMRDAWTVGVFGPYVLGVWMGNFNGQGNPHLIGRDMAAPLFFDLVDSVRATTQTDDSALWAWMPPPGLKEVEICPISGKLPGPHCHHHKKIFFIPGTSPIDTCDVHREIWVSRRDGLQTCGADHDRDEKRIVEYWPTDLLSIFTMAGLPRKEIPGPGPSCKGMNPLLAQTGNGPEILSPKADTVYSLRSQNRDQNSIPLQASFTSDARKVFWFIDQEFIGESKAGTALFWPARSGRFQVRAVDEKGRSAQRTVEVRYVD